MLKCFVNYLERSKTGVWVEFIDTYNYWSVMRLMGSFLMTMTLGYVAPQFNPLKAGCFVLSGGVGWEVVVDQTFRWNDRRGGDFYDVLWDLTGCALDTAVLMSTEKRYRAQYLNHISPGTHSIRSSPPRSNNSISNKTSLGVIPAYLRENMLRLIQDHHPRRLKSVALSCRMKLDEWSWKLWAGSGY